MSSRPYQEVLRPSSYTVRMQAALAVVVAGRGRGDAGRMRYRGDTAARSWQWTQKCWRGAVG